jgi:parvulin-like peptidyl-prolyl isomerase
LGYIGWSDVGEHTNIVVDPLAEAVRNAANLGILPEPVQTYFGWHVVKVEALEERPVSEKSRDLARTRPFETWLVSQRNAHNIVINPDWEAAIPPNLRR